MTFEELKVEAKKQGYKLIKDEPYIPFKPCVCGCNRRSEWHVADLFGSIKYECQNCGRTATGKNKKEAKQNWNEMMRNF